MGSSVLLILYHFRTSVGACAYIGNCLATGRFSSILFKFRMSRSDPTGALLLGTGAGVWIFFKGFRVFREFKIVADTPCMPIRSIPMGLVQVRGQALTDQLIPSPITHTPCCFYQIKIERYETGEHGGWKHHRTDMDGAKFYIQDKTGKVLVDSYSAEYDLPENPPRIVDGAHIAPLMGTGASDQELLQYVQKAGVNQLAGKMEHWLENKGPLDDPKHEQGGRLFSRLPERCRRRCRVGQYSPDHPCESDRTNHGVAAAG